MDDNEVQHLLSAHHMPSPMLVCVTHYIWSTSDVTVWQLQLIPPERNWGLRLNNLPKVTKPASAKAGIWTEVEILWASLGGSDTKESAHSVVPWTPNL